MNVKDKNLGDKIDINTGEENEQCKFSARVKLFELALMKESAKTTVMEWKEKGSGTVRVNEEPESGSSRIIVRAEGVLRVLINVRLFKGMRFEIVQHRSVRFAAIDDKNTTSHYILRFKTVEEACNFLLECTVHCENSDEASTS